MKKNIAIILLTFSTLVLACLSYRLSVSLCAVREKPALVEEVCDTVWLVDTIRDTTFIPRWKKIVRVDTAYLTTVSHDTVSVIVPIEQQFFVSDRYRLWVSGYRVNIDSADIVERQAYIPCYINRDRRPDFAITVGPYVGVSLRGEFSAGVCISAGLPIYSKIWRK